MPTFIKNRCDFPIIVGKLYDEIRPPQSESQLCNSNEVVAEVEVVSIEQAGTEHYALLRRSGEGIDLNASWLDVDYLRLRSILCV